MKEVPNAFTNPTRLWTLYNEFVQNYTQLMTTETLRMWGLGQESKPLIEPEHGDKRFVAPDWQQNPVFDALKQSYLLAATTLLKTVSGIEGLDEKHKRQLTFFLRQYLDAISPTNFAFTNPQVIHETIASGGQNLVKGMQNLIRDINAGEIKITDTSAFEVGKNLAITPGQVVYRNELIELIQYAPTTEQVHEIPLLFVPPWVNKYYILDLQPQNSFIRFMVEQGFTAFVISWKNPDSSMEHISFEDYVSLGPVAALEVIKEITGSPKVNTAGYREICLENGLSKPNKIVMKGVPINLHKIRQDVYAFGAAQDHIVPWKAAWRTTQLTGGSVRFVLGKSGHIAGAASPPQKSHGYWTNEKHTKSADKWLEGAEFHQGGWWSDWVEWIEPRSGGLVVPPSVGSQAHPPMVPAPGTYVLEK